MDILEDEEGACPNSIVPARLFPLSENPSRSRQNTCYHTSIIFIDFISDFDGLLVFGI
jgi:hypothetical protein